MNQQTAAFTAAEHLGSDLMGLVLQEIKALPDVWQKIPEAKQKDVIDRVENSVRNAVQLAVITIASNGHTRVVADLDGIAIKNDIKATFVVSRGNPHESLQTLYESQGEPCLLLLISPDEYTGGMDEFEADPDQPELPVGESVFDVENVEY